MALTELGPFADAGLLILASLAAGPKHGYAMLEDIEEMAGVRMGPGTLYTTLARLQQRGWIEALPAEDTRRPYRLTGAGTAGGRGPAWQPRHLSAFRARTIGHRGP